MKKLPKLTDQVVDPVELYKQHPIWWCTQYDMNGNIAYTIYRAQFGQITSTVLYPSHFKSFRELSNAAWSWVQENL